MPTTEQKLKGVNFSRTLLTCFEAYYEKFHRRLVTLDDTQIQSQQWKHFGSPTPKNVQHSVSVGQMMVSLFF